MSARNRIVAFTQESIAPAPIYQQPKIEIPLVVDPGVADEQAKRLENILGSICTTSELLVKDGPLKPRILGDWFREGDIGFIFSLRGVGKTWYAYDLGKSIATGCQFGTWQYHGEPRNVLYIDGEVSANDMKGRTHALEAGSDRFSYLSHELLFNKCGETIDLANAGWQSLILGACKQKQIKVLILDNLSCLANTIDENEGVAWSSTLLRWIISLRNHGISVVFIQHANRTGIDMRGNSRREDPANWIIRLSPSWKAGEEKIGAKFVSRFTKCRNAQSYPDNQEFHYKPDGDKTRLVMKKADDYSAFVELVNDGVDSNAEIAEALDLKKYEVTRLAQKAARNDDIKIQGKKYLPGYSGR
jgi:AAA domain